MEIGTPLFEGAKKLLWLGGGELGKEMVIEAQRMGVETVVIDRYDLAPAMHVAHRKYVVNMHDGGAIESIIRKERPDAVIAEIEAINTETLSKIEMDGIKVMPNARAVKICMDRIELRRFAAEKVKVPTTAYGFATSPEEVKKMCKDVGYPCIIKPQMSSSGHGHEVIYDESQVEEKFKEALTHARGKSKTVIVEEYVKIDRELTVLTYRYPLSSGGVATKTIYPVEHQRPQGVYHYIESWHPATVSQDVISKASEYATKVVNELGGFGIFGVEIMIAGNRVLFNEVAPRPHDTGLVTLVSSDISEFQVHVRSALGLPTPDVKVVTPAAAHVILASGEKWAPKYINVDKALEIPGVQVRLFGKPVTYNERRMGIVLATGNSVEEAKEKVRKASALILVS
ncbi:formate-dependent phosphoribosylglycinamide formyltransferase [Sulfolobus acidocaldarius]|uniref:Formate-dependent phosphoribosylglycinamide formyltransferase n=4 Tax=Sulfolobus acidocaldarius TaxID=2285 RepID=PURT_SULAC|nr:formate-dependent phosphoribosylglycinamide formyltransferase [Sulfolobus acidocaldarius]Q4JC46.1 RecName: Full=Formate-dependent phosphoribosylglycinamide formyltransferase; AltName: Full=5'-phosphoribosylglycinamide transformylase 2; AltName: Full=Formate-dependent GAR transformylase; AltName: Full=GAR transformylase 2; Short=GART 2; AltName: Full=Non-folate glycinamide ribonucleotide transformylase; AltName: Full=Phosphoribosylglycinamide formyltransferase 2 [Sulfolobus acidocaldarius DSM 63